MINFKTDPFVQLQVRMDLEIMAMKKYSTFPRSLELKPHQLSTVISRPPFWGWGLTLRQILTWITILLRGFPASARLPGIRAGWSINDIHNSLDRRV